MAAPSMDAMAERFASHGVGSIFLYTHEAHPGEHYPHLTSMEQKLRHARALSDVLGVGRAGKLLDRLLEIIDPEVIVTLGRFSLAYISPR